MNELLNLAVKAHGSLERWNKVNSIKVAASITGGIWYVKSKPDYLKEIVMTAETKRERLTTDFPGQDKRSIFEPERIVIEKLDGTLIETRDDPEKSFEGQQRETPWDDIHVAYFAGEALWTYLNTPFLYTYDGFATEEIPSIKVEGETWRRLKVTFPDTIKSHTRVQISCFGPDGLLRRHDYTVDILGGATGLNYASDYRNVDGIVVPTKRRVYAYEGDYQPVREPLLVAIDMGEIAIAQLYSKAAPARKAMKAVQLSSYGDPPAVLKCVDLAEPNAPGGDQVLIENALIHKSVSGFTKNVLRQNAAVLGNLRRKALGQGEVSSSTTHVCYHIAVFQFQGLDHVLRPLPPVSLTLYQLGIVDGGFAGSFQRNAIFGRIFRDRNESVLRVTWKRKPNHEFGSLNWIREQNSEVMSQFE